MNNEETKRAMELFDECTKILKGTFRDKEMFWLAYQRHKVIIAMLEKLGFTVKTEKHLNRKRETLLRGDLEIQEIGFTLKLIPQRVAAAEKSPNRNPRDDSYISISHPTAKINIGY